ncbi:hypothetical protein PybrP1_008552 [[Pythium] brassicae (nom. inval.)]|nr:hypothetical protein PybrP1_008552 [[Pythium] brassicae (nom. inval.)]
MRRRNAFERPLHPAQLLAAGVIVEAAAAFFFLSARELPPPERRACTLLFATQLLVVVLLFVLISLRDPALPACCEGDSQQRDATPAAAFLDCPARVKCAQCGVRVTRDSRHCRACGKCVAGYDHHCVYLNTCIGARNYPLFVGLLSCTVLLLATYAVVSGYAIARLRAGSSKRGGAPTVRVVALCALSLPPLLQLVCTLVLGAFHLYFWARGISTYEFLHERQAGGTGEKGRSVHAHQTQRLQVLLAERRSDDSDASGGSSSSSGGRSSPGRQAAMATAGCASETPPVERSAQQEPHLA